MSITARGAKGVKRVADRVPDDVRNATRGRVNQTHTAWLHARTHSRTRTRPLDVLGKLGANETTGKQGKAQVYYTGGGGNDRQRQQRHPNLEMLDPHANNFRVQHETEHITTIKSSSPCLIIGVNLYFGLPSPPPTKTQRHQNSALFDHNTCGNFTYPLNMTNARMDNTIQHPRTPEYSVHTSYHRYRHATAVLTWLPRYIPPPPPPPPPPPRPPLPLPLPLPLA